MLSVPHLLIVLVIVLVIFGTKKLRSIGSDMGGAVKGFKDAMKDDKDTGSDSEITHVATPKQVDADFKSTPPSSPSGNPQGTSDSADKRS